MKLLTILSLSFALSISQAFAGQTSCPQFFPGGSAPEYLNQKVSAKTRQLCNDGYALGHSGVTRTSLWSAEHLTAERLAAGKGLPRAIDFRPDDRLPPSERAELRDYARSGFDRGHQTPAADSATPAEQSQTFLLSNMLPQDAQNNRNLHEGIESAIRKEAKKVGEIYIMSGPLYLGENLQALKGRVLIPSALFKCLYYPRANKAGCFVENNSPGMAYNTASVSEVEQAAGINLFPALPPDVKSRAAQLPTPTPHSKGRR
jgi:endonuclease G, mitochondrial